MDGAVLWISANGKERSAPLGTAEVLRLRFLKQLSIEFVLLQCHVKMYA